MPSISAWLVGLYASSVVQLFDGPGYGGGSMGSTGRTRTSTVAARLEADLVARMDRLVAAGVAATRTDLIAQAVAAWASAAEARRWSSVEAADVSLEDGFEPSWDDDPVDWSELYADLLPSSDVS